MVIEPPPGEEQTGVCYILFKEITPPPLSGDSDRKTALFEVLCDT